MDNLVMDPIEEFYEKEVGYQRDFVTRDEVEDLYNAALDIIGSSGNIVSKEFLLNTIANGKRKWISYPKFYRKRQVLINALKFISGNNMVGNSISKIESYTIRDFYSSIEYDKISYASKSDMIESIILEGERARAFLEKTKKRRASNRRNTDYSFSAIMLISLLLWEGFKAEEIASIKMSDVTSISISCKGKRILVDRSAVRYLNEWVNAKQRVDLTGYSVDISNREYLFGVNGAKAPNKLIVHRSLLAYNDFAEREISSVSVSRTILFNKVKSGAILKSNLTEIEQLEYDCWHKTFVFNNK